MAASRWPLMIVSEFARCRARPIPDATFFGNDGTPGGALLLVALPSTWSVVRCIRGWEQRNAITALLAIEGCQVAYDGEHYFEPLATRDNSHLGATTSGLGVTLAAWAETMLGVDAVHRCGTASFPCDKVDAVMPRLKQLPYLRRVVVLEPHGGTKEDPDQVHIACRRVKKE